MLDDDRLNYIQPPSHPALLEFDPDENFFNDALGGLNIPNESKYYSIDSFNTMFRDNSPSLDFMVHNIRSYNRNSDSFIAMLTSLCKLPEVIVLTETWLTPNDEDKNLLEGYTEFNTVRSGRSGGVSVLCCDNLTVSHIPELSRCNNTIESCVVQVECNSDRYIIFAVYRPHSDIIENFNETLYEMLHSDVLRGKSVILMGDMNIDLLKQNLPHVSAFVDIMHSTTFVPAITKATRFPPAGSAIAPSLLDHIWTNRLSIFTSGIICIDNTDHCPAFMKLSIDCPTNRAIKLTFRIHKPDSVDKFRDDVKNLVNNISVLGDVNVDTAKLISDINALYVKCFPSKVKYISSKRLSKPWISTGILNSIKTKCRYFKLCKLGIIDAQTNRRYRNCLNAVIRKAKNYYYIKTFKMSQNNIKKTWSLIKQLMSTKSKDNCIKNIIVNNIEISNPSEMAEQFNNYFADIAHTLDNEINPSNQDPYVHVKENNLASIFFHPVTVNEINTIILNLKNTTKKLHEIPVQLFKGLSKILSKPITELVNASIGSGVFPECLKQSKVVPIYKKGDRNTMANYRPISILPTMSKIFEKCISNRLITFLNKYDVIFPRQFGFRTGRSTADAFLSMVEYVYSCLNRKEHCIGVFIDLKKAFDTVNHEILLGKLERSGIRGLPLRWMASYLKDRRQCVTIDGKCSSQRIINIGIPQGSILGPQLFLLYVNDLPNVSSKLRSILYADDTTLLANNSDYSTLTQCINDELPKLYQWTIANRLTVSLDKTYSMLFSNRDSHLEKEDIYWNNETVKYKEIEEFLGLTIDHKLKFTDHIYFVCKKLSKTVGILYRLKGFVPCNVLVSLYYSLAYPYLLYANVVWGGTCQVHLEPLVILQKRIIRIVTNADYYAHTEPLFKTSSILKISDLHNFLLAQYMYRRRLCGDDMFEVSHEHDTRGRNNAQQVFQRLTQTQLSVSFAGPRVWNSLPPNIQNSATLGMFKRLVKEYYLARYNE